ncbi:Cysteine-rich small domain protein [Thiorhodovibrio winogradskyi]|uniref:Cysteine-rich small domain protein n=1 Tax=Thiorhodovibrio winogradskyi TaxID=77007 RepID=A0ABZ0SIL5_9GAMM|nr:cysteine-rich small domain-containing protein [Thiorhodovibrio winogradskyi]
MAEANIVADDQPPPPEARAFKGFTHRACEYYPCHHGVRRAFNCLFCYCPLIERECPGPYRLFTDMRGTTRKDCSACRLAHDGIHPSWAFIQRWLDAPPFRGQPQSRARIRALSQALRQKPRTL